MNFTIFNSATSSSALCLFKDTTVSIQYIMADLNTIFVKLPSQSCILVSQIISDTCLHPLHHTACTLFSTSFADHPLLFLWLTPGIYIHPPSLFLASSPLDLSHRHSQIIHLYIIYIFSNGSMGCGRNLRGTKIPMFVSYKCLFLLWKLLKCNYFPSIISHGSPFHYFPYLS